MSKKEEGNLNSKNTGSRKAVITLLSAILIGVVGTGGYMIYQDQQDNKVEVSKSNVEVHKVIAENMETNKNVLNKEKILTYLESIKKNEDAVLSGEEEFTQNLDVQLAVKYQDAAFYYKYLIVPLLTNEEEEFKFQNIKFAYQSILFETLSLDEAGFKEALEAMSKGIDESALKGDAIADKKLVTELNDLLKKEADILQKIYDNYEFNDSYNLVVKEGKQPISSTFAEALYDSFYEENDLSNHTVQYSLAFDLFQNSLSLNGKANETYVDQLLEVLNSPAYYEFAVLDDLVSNMTFDETNQDKPLDKKDKEYVLNQIETTRAYLGQINENNFYRIQMVKVLNNFEALLEDDTKTLQELSQWYILAPKDINIFSKDSIKNSFFMIAEEE